MEIRLAIEHDAEAIASLLLEAFSPFESEYTSGAFEYTTPKADVIRGRFIEGPIWVAEEGDMLIGTVSGLPELDRFYIRSMAVKREMQGRGVGQLLLGVLEAYAREKGFTRLFLYTTYVLPDAKRLYERNGFVTVRETPPDEWFGMGGLEMEKNLD